VIYQWDLGKAKANLNKHDVSFDEAITVFLDPFALTFDDPDHSSDEQRFVTIGTSSTGRIIFLAHADSGDDNVRIISARSATSTEAYAYQESRN